TPQVPKIVAVPIHEEGWPRLKPSIGRSRRGWVWAALTLAAALLLMVYDRSRAPQPQLAKGPQSTTAKQSAPQDLAFESRDERLETKFGDARIAQDPAGS